jgi:hypothetical protein
MEDWVHSLPDKLRISGRLDFVESKPRRDACENAVPRMEPGIVATGAGESLL